MIERVQVTVDFEKPGDVSLEDCCLLVMHQMQARPEWDDPAGTGQLNYVCHDRTIRIVKAEIKESPHG